MSYATIMVHLEWDVEVDARVRLAAGLADRLSSELIGINAWMPRPRPIVEDKDVVKFPIIQIERLLVDEVIAPAKDGI